MYSLYALLGLATISLVKANNPDLSDCAYDCVQEADSCESSSGDCQNFISLYSSSGYATAFATSDAFIANTTSYCSVTNGTTTRCDSYTTSLIDCMSTSTCWFSTTTYSPNCDYYALVVAHYSATSSTQSVVTLCAALWGAYFDNFLGNDYLNVNVSVSPCQSNRRALLATESGEGGEGGEGERSSESESSESSENGEGSSITVTLEVTFTFYSEYSYSTYYDYLVTGNNAFTSGFVNEGYISGIQMRQICLTTTCCGATGDCTNNYDVACTTTTKPTTTTSHESSASTLNISFLFLNGLLIAILRFLF